MDILVVLLFEEIILCPELSKSPRFKIKGASLSVTYTGVVGVVGVVVVAGLYFPFLI